MEVGAGKARGGISDIRITGGTSDDDDEDDDHRVLPVRGVNRFPECCDSALLSLLLP